MPREARIDIAHHWYHVISRGQRREALFHSAKDFRTYLTILEGGLDRNRACLGAYCLMPNHIHLLVYRKSSSLGTIFRQINMDYASYFNLKYGKTGYVFQGRFKSFLVLDDAYLGVLLRYIHENPVRAGLARPAARYRWSSDLFYRETGTVTKDIRLIRVPGYEGRVGTRTYRDMMADDEVNLSTLPCSGQIIGTAEEIKGMNRRSRSRTRWFREDRRDQVTLDERMKVLLESVGRLSSKIVTPTQTRNISRIRTKMMAQLYREGYPPAQIARAFKKTATAVIRAHERCR